MTNYQAAIQAKKRWGKAGYVRNSEHFTSPEKRQASTDTIKAAQAEFDAIVREIKERLAACDWYQELQTKKRAAFKKLEEAKYHRTGYRFFVGKQGAVFTEILGQGDTWEEAFAEADRRTSKAA
jgi:hypothetical protein